MSNLDITIEKLLRINQHIKELRELKPSSYLEYVKDLKTKYAIERIMQLIVDLALDINNIILSYLGRPPSPDYFSSFIELSEYGVLEPKFAEDIAPSSGLRNRLVHEYEKINDKIIYESIDKFIEVYSIYLKEINQFITKQERKSKS